MALKVLLLRKRLDDKKEELESKEEERKKLFYREQEIERAIEEIDENTSKEEKDAVEKEVDDLEAKKDALNSAIEVLKGEIKKIEEEIKSGESNEQKPSESDDKETKPTDQRKGRDFNIMKNRTTFFGMNVQERNAFFANNDVREFLERVREIGKLAAAQNRNITGAELTIPTAVLDLIRENIMDYSKLVSKVRLRSVSGKARQTVMGTIPEAVWTEMCARLNELDFGFTQVEVDGYKVGGVIYICRATLEDSDIDLATEIIQSLGIAIGIALDKAILYGFGTKMPLGIVTRLAQTSAPSGYPATARPWENLKPTHMVTISNDKHGIDFYKEIVLAGGNAKGKYSRGEKFWAMNETTYTTLKVEAMTFNSAGAILSVQDGTMPVAGGDIIVLSDDIIPDNNIVAGYGDLYLLAERAGSNFERSDEYKFAEDQVAFKGTARYDGEPVIAEGFIAIGIGSAPVESVSFTGDTANDASLSELTIGTETLNPTFSADKYEYTLTAAGTKGVINAVTSQTAAKVEMTYNDKKLNNGQEITFASGTKNLIIAVKNGLGIQTYTVAVTKG